MADAYHKCKNHKTEFEEDCATQGVFSPIKKMGLERLVFLCIKK